MSQPPYHDPDWPYDLLAASFALERASTALLVIDMQARDLAPKPQSEMARRYPAVASYWQQRLDQTVVPNLQRLIETFRSSGCPVAYTRNGNMTPVGDEMSPRLKAKRKEQFSSSRKDPEYDIDPRLAPTENDLVIDKLTSGAFTMTPLDHALRNMGVRTIVVTGILTDMCILGTARVGAELGYNSVIVDDATATFTQRAQNEAMAVHARVFGRVMTSEKVMAELSPRRGKNQR